MPIEPLPVVTAHVGDRVTLTLPGDWKVLRWEGWDHPAAGDGGNVWAPVDVIRPTRQIDLPVPGRLGNSVAGYSLWLQSVDARIVGRLDIQLTVRVQEG